MPKVAPEPNNYSDKHLDNGKTEKSIYSSALTGHIIGSDDTSTNTQENQRTYSNGNHCRSRKRLPRSVSEVVEEKEKQEANVCTRFANKYRRHGCCGIMMAIGDEGEIFSNRCANCFKFIYRFFTCKKLEDEEEE